MQWLDLDFTHLANATIAFFTAVVAYAAVYIGRRSAAKPDPAETAALSIKGAAIVSSESVVALGVEMAALRATATAVAAQHVGEGEKMRKIGYKLVEMCERMEREMSELRKEISDLAKEVARRR